MYIVYMWLYGYVYIYLVINIYTYISKFTSKCHGQTTPSSEQR